MLNTNNDMPDEHSLKKDVPFKMSGQLPGLDIQKKGFFDRIRVLFSKKQEPPVSDVSLTGRIHAQLRQDAHSLVEQLKNLKENLRKELEGRDDSHLWTSFEAVVNPLLREYEYIEKKLMAKTANTLEEKTTALKSFGEWADKAKLWAALSARPVDRKRVIKAVIINTLQVFDVTIDRDLKTLHEYMTHELNNLKCSSEKLIQVAEQMEAELHPHIEGLVQLKNQKPSDLLLEHLQGWKLQMDEKRAKHYHAALQIIDNRVDAIAPHKETAEEHEHAKEVFARMAYLEEEVPALLDKAKKIDPEDSESIRLLIEREIELEVQTRQLVEDLRLPPELEDRVQELVDLISGIRELLHHR